MGSAVPHFLAALLIFALKLSRPLRQPAAFLPHALSEIYVIQLWAAMRAWTALLLLHVLHQRFSRLGLGAAWVPDHAQLAGHLQRNIQLLQVLIQQGFGQD